MSVDTKMFVTCGKDKLFDVMTSVIRELDTLSRYKLDEYLIEAGLENRFQYKKEEHEKKFTNGCHIHARSTNMISFDFGVGDINLRSLNMFPDCSCDYDDIYDGEKIIFSIGHWGSYGEIMKSLYKALAPFGDVYYDHNDCDEYDFVLIDNVDSEEFNK